MASSWKCEFCKTVNYNEGYLELYAKNVDFTKAHNLLQVGMASYEGQDYKKALEVLEKVLFEDSSSQDAWVYAALCIAYLSDLSNLEESFKKTQSYLFKAREINPDTDIISVGSSVARNALGRTSLRAIRRSREFAEKKYFAYESIDRPRAIRERDVELKTIYLYAKYALAEPPDNPEISGPIAVEILLAAMNGGCPTQLKVKAKDILDSIKTINSDYYNQLEVKLSPTQKRKSGCATACLYLAIWLTSGIMLFVFAVIGLVWFLIQNL